MKRTTLPIAPSLLKAIKEIAREEGVTMRKVISNLIELGLKARAKSDSSRSAKTLRWHSQSMKARVNYEDKDELIKILDSHK